MSTWRGDISQDNVSEDWSLLCGNAFLCWSKIPYLTVFQMLFRHGPGGCHGDRGRQWCHYDLGVGIARMLTQNLKEFKFVFLGSLALPFALLVIINLPFPSALPPICSLSQALESRKPSFPPLDWKFWPSVYLKRIPGSQSKALSEENKQPTWERQNQKELLLPFHTDDSISA